MLKYKLSPGEMGQPRKKGKNLCFPMTLQHGARGASSVRVSPEDFSVGSGPLVSYSTCRRATPLCRGFLPAFVTPGVIVHALLEKKT